MLFPPSFAPGALLVFYYHHVLWQLIETINVVLQFSFLPFFPYLVPSTLLPEYTLCYCSCYSTPAALSTLPQQHRVMAEHHFFDHLKPKTKGFDPNDNNVGDATSQPRGDGRPQMRSRRLPRDTQISDSKLYSLLKKAEVKSKA